MSGATERKGESPAYDCEDCIGMREHGCYCQALGAKQPGGPAMETKYSNEPSEFDKGYMAGIMQAYNEVDMWCKARLDQLEPGKSKAYRDEVYLARVKLLHRLRYFLPAKFFPTVWK